LYKREKMEDALWARFARLAWVRGSLVKYVIGFQESQHLLFQDFYSKDKYELTICDFGRDAQFSLTYGRMYKEFPAWPYVPYKLVRLLCLIIRPRGHDDT
jgi:hypothetical protein